MPEITGKLRKWRVSVEWLQSKAEWLLKEADWQIDCPNRELFHMLNSDPQSSGINIYILSPCDGPNVTAFCQIVDKYKLYNEPQK